MAAKLYAHLRHQWMGALALFLVLAGGTAYSANTVFSSDIVDGQVKTPDLAGGAVTSEKVADQGLRGRDVLDNTLKGADIDESTLSNVGGGGAAGGDLTGTYPNPAIAPGAVDFAKLDPAAFAAGDIPPQGSAFGVSPNAIQSSEVSDGAITGADVGDNTLGSSDIGTGAVGGVEIADNAVRSEELGPIYERMGEQVFPDGGTGQNGDWGTAQSAGSCLPGDELTSAYAVWHGAESGEELAISSLNMNPDTDTATAVGANDSGSFHGFEVWVVCLG